MSNTELIAEARVVVEGGLLDRNPDPLTLIDQLADALEAATTHPDRETLVEAVVNALGGEAIIDPIPAGIAVDTVLALFRGEGHND